MTSTTSTRQAPTHSQFRRLRAACLAILLTMLGGGVIVLGFLEFILGLADVDLRLNPAAVVYTMWLVALAASCCSGALLGAEHGARRSGQSDRWRTANITLAWMMILGTVFLWIPFSLF